VDNDTDAMKENGRRACAKGYTNFQNLLKMMLAIEGAYAIDFSLIPGLRDHE
jgi:hypothetical protein